MSYDCLLVYTLYCDTPGCEATSGDYLPYKGKGLRGARQEARRDGWTYRAGEDFCPDHPAGGSAAGGQSEVTAWLASAPERDRALAGQDDPEEIRARLADGSGEAGP